MTRSQDEKRSPPPSPPPPPPPPPMRRPNIEERISMIQMAMLHHQGRYLPSLSSQGAIALVLPPLPPHVAITQPSSSSSLSNPKAVVQNPHPKDSMLRRLASSLGCGDKKTKKHGGYHAPPVDDIITVRRLSESEW